LTVRQLIESYGYYAVSFGMPLEGETLLKSHAAQEFRA